MKGALAGAVTAAQIDKFGFFRYNFWLCDQLNWSSAVFSGGGRLFRELAMDSSRIGAAGHGAERSCFLGVNRQEIDTCNVGL